ncbi:hypothetical protein EJ05DRAFT_378676 [Pseudovirgaria hyperparasitica]|uniref:Glycosyltransferase family 31 protein n=1 Tax=Pseudovirgaria hyperparasitica TaxID=470096 RepID=A0A6A6W7Y2_9PEZI|nr:uncharacterized protein EJ05DRAFT_378676 [Pseudovirgaria hyperparasitica]KAF2758134.1 hypothetical protein EJ05DRAFT_378676 [Pseudovirgaria hyperparasitica]
MMAWSPPSAPSRRRGIIPLLTFLIFVVYLEFLPHPSLDSWRRSVLHSTTKWTPADLPCAHLPGAEDVFVIVRTGATEVHHRLPIHLETTLHCVPDFAIFSDLEEEIQGLPVHDALDDLSEVALKEYPELDFYHDLHRYKAEGRNISALIETHGRQSSVRDKAWNLDKWKFLPLMSKAYAMRPSAKWYVVIEADTSILWSNILHWLNTLDPSEPMYIGGQTWGGAVKFGHGGSGIIISQPAMQMLVEKQARNIELFEKISGDDWAGDRALSVAFRKVGLQLTEAFPMIQGETPYTLDFTENHWCHPVVTYHHMPPNWIRRVWEFEQAWITSPHLANQTIYHRHMFDAFILPEIQSERLDWDNMSNDVQTPFHPPTIDHCRKLCEMNRKCMQWHFAPGSCRTNHVVRLGQAISPDFFPEQSLDTIGLSSPGPNLEDVESSLSDPNLDSSSSLDPSLDTIHHVERDSEDITKFLKSARPTSGWMLERITAFKERLGRCKKPWAGAYRFD